MTARKTSLLAADASSHDGSLLLRHANASTLSLSPRRPGTAASGSTTRPRRGSRFQHVDDSTSFMNDQDAEDEEGAAFSLVDRMRNWRNDAMTQHLYSTAEFWGGKVFGLTSNPDDAFWLAQIHFLTHQFAQAERILTRSRQADTSTRAERLTDTSLACRYLAAQCQVRLGKWEEALEMVGRTSLHARDVPSFEAGDGGIRLTASTAHMRGVIHLHLGASDLAKDAFIEALTRDVKCFESFQALVGGEMMSSEEEWEFIQGLPFLAQTAEDAEFVRMMYTVRLKKLAHHSEMEAARERLTKEFGLGEDPDVLFSRADELYTGMRYAECFKLTSRVLATNSSHRPTLPIHLSCMHYLPHLRSKLFLFAHQLVDSDPDNAISWYAVGLWYFAGKRWEESRRFFGKSVLIDSRFGPAWLAFAHSYAFEGEHDQAITAYSTALRHSPGSHMPILCIGMQQLGLMNLVLAHEYLSAARRICPDDPLAANELGVVAVHDGRYSDAVALFNEALRIAKPVQGSPLAWSTTHLNLGHALRKLQRYSEAAACFHRVIQLDPRSAGAYSALGLVEHLAGHWQESIARYHEALSISPGDPVTCDLLKLVLEDVANQTHSTSRSTASSSSTPAAAATSGFPGLPRSILLSIDDQVALLDRDILDGVEPVVEGESAEAEGLAMETFESSTSRGGRTAAGGMERSATGEEEEEDDEESMMDASASMDMTIE